jgi:hypothetical protein
MPFALVVKGILVELTNDVKDYLRQSAAALRGFDRRLFMARTVRFLGGGLSLAERELGWCRVTLRKALHEFDSGILCLDAFSRRAEARRGPPPRPAGRHPLPG